MNEKQKNLLIAVAIIIVAMLIYPPYHVLGANGFVGQTGYGWIFDLPYRATVNPGALILEWIGVAIVGGIGYFVLKDQ